MISEIFITDHQEIDALLQALAGRLSAEVSADQRDSESLAALAGEVHRRLRRHIQWEEELLFPAVEAKSPDLAGGPGPVMREEHKEILSHLQRLEGVCSVETAGESERAEARRLLQAVEAVLVEHNEKEEGIYYPLCDELLDEAESADILGRLAQME